MRPQKPENPPAETPLREEEEEDDPWDARIKKTGCAEENAKLNDCFYATRDWRKCAKEMQEFRKCWNERGNRERTEEK